MRKLKWLTFQLTTIGLILLAGEVILRYKGYSPGNIQPNWANFKTVDSLYEIDEFISDSSGILIANSSYFKKQPFEINSWGFRFNRDKLADTTKTKVMLIGDSFTWGLSAKPIDSCFAYLLGTIGNYNVFNLGIPAADPVQYAAIAEKYTDSIKPDILIVALYTGNDIMLKDRDINQKPFYYYTNAGAILAHDGNTFFNTAHEAYQYYAFHKYRIIKPHNIVEHLACKSALVTRLYALRYRWQERKAKQYAIEHPDITIKYLQAVKAIADIKHIPFIVALIPERKELEWYKPTIESQYFALWNNDLLKTTLWQPKLNVSMYNDYPDGHFNNIGHRAFALQLALFVDSIKPTKRLP